MTNWAQVSRTRNMQKLMTEYKRSNRWCKFYFLELAIKSEVCRISFYLKLQFAFLFLEHDVWYFVVHIVNTFKLLQSFFRVVVEGQIKFGIIDSKTYRMTKPMQKTYCVSQISCSKPKPSNLENNQFLSFHSSHRNYPSMGPEIVI